jgi:4-amino-4-deoxy-L-arabinose transferase-like glycosyltransferase
MKFDKNYLYLTLLGAVFFIPFLGQAHLFDWDEINFAECAREMLVTGDYLNPRIGFEAFWEKPPLFIWLQTLSMQVFGVNEFAARLPNAIVGILTLLTVYRIGSKLYDSTFGWLWALCYFGSITPFLYHKSGIIDPIFNLFIFLSLIFYIEHEQNTPPQYKTTSKLFSHRFLIIGGIFSGLAILTKGPVGYLIVALTWLFKTLIYKDLSWLRIKRFAIFSIVAALTASVWFGVGVLKNGLWFLQEFITYNIRLAKTEDAGHGGFVGYHFVVLLVGCFPSSIFALSAIWWRYNFYGEKTDFTRWMRVLFWVVLILFSLVQSKIVHYSSMCYLPLTFLAALTLKRYSGETFVIPAYVRWFIGILGSLLGLAIAAIPFLSQKTDLLKPYFKDPFAQGNLEAQVSWQGWEMFVGILLIVVSIAFALIFKEKRATNNQFPISNNQILRGVFALFLSVAVFIQLTLYFFVPNIEAFSQRAAIDFYQSKRTENCYIGTFGYKSYAHLFYSDYKQPTDKNHQNMEFLLRGVLDKPTYIVGKINSKNDLDKFETLRFLYQKNGFVFYERKR